MIDIIGILGFISFSTFIFFYGKPSEERTEKAKELNSKLEGLKSYLKDYSNLKDNEASNIVLWEDYLIYSVIFKQNKKIISEFKKYYEIT